MPNYFKENRRIALIWTSTKDYYIKHTAMAPSQRNDARRRWQNITKCRRRRQQKRREDYSSRRWLGSFYADDADHTLQQIWFSQFFYQTNLWQNLEIILPTDC